MVRYIIQVLRAGQWDIEGKYTDRYTASATYNAMTERPRRLLEIGPNGGQLIRDSHEDGKAAEFAASNQRADRA